MTHSFLSETNNVAEAPGQSAPQVRPNLHAPLAGERALKGGMMLND